MSNLVDVTRLTQTSVQLPVSWYLDFHILELEKHFLFDQGLGYVGPYQSPMEDGMMHFHEFLRRKIEPHIFKF